ncbi:MAG: SDR family NAD(P)-dependent oxidoreductase [Pseudomonadota bacterium]
MADKSTGKQKDITVLVTGASSGIGQAIAGRLLDEGYRVIVMARRESRLADFVAALGPAARCAMAVADVTDRPGTHAALAALPEPFRAIDVLVNNAGLALGLDRAAEADFTDWETMINVNCTALAWLTRELLPAMVERRRGHVVNIGSTAALYPYRGGNAYGATKAFVAQFSLNLRADLLGTPIRTTLIEPGLVGGSEFSDVRFHGDADSAKAVYAGTEPLTPADVADAVAWALNQPAHVNVNRIELMPVCQAADQIGLARQS